MTSAHQQENNYL